MKKSAKVFNKPEAGVTHLLGGLVEGILGAVGDGLRGGLVALGLDGAGSVVGLASDGFGGLVQSALLRVRSDGLLGLDRDPVSSVPTIPSSP